MTSRRLAEQHLATLEAFLSLLRSVPTDQRSLKLTNADTTVADVWPEARGLTTPRAVENMLFWPESSYVQARTAFDDLSDFTSMTEVVNAEGRVAAAQFERAPVGAGKSSIAQFISRIDSLLTLTRQKLRRPLWPWVLGGIVVASGVATAMIKNRTLNAKSPKKTITLRRRAAAY